MDSTVYFLVPPFHPGCRGTTVPYFDDMEGYGERAARDLEGNTFYVPSDTTYEQWKQMQDAKYGAGSVDKTRKMEYNKSTDLKQYEQYKNILKENAPIDFSSFKKLKYEDTQQWKYTKGLVDYLRKYPTSDKRYYDVQRKLESLGIKKGVALPPVQKQAYILPSGKKDPYHIMYRMKERNITDDNLREYMRDAKVMFSQWGGIRQLFVGEAGMCAIVKDDDKWIFKTAWTKYDYDDESNKIMEAIKNAGL